MERERAALALSVVQGLLRDDPAAQRLVVEAFDTVEDAATAYAYLVGYLVEHLASLRDEPVDDVLADLRRRLRP